MKHFFKMALASTVGVIIGAIFLYFISLVMLITIVMAVGGGSSAKPITETTILEINLTGEIADRLSLNPFDFLSQTDSKNYGLNDLLAAIKAAKENKKIKGIYLKVGALSTGYASSQQIRQELLSFKESGKVIIAYGETITQNGYYIASVADKIFLNPEGIIDLHGLSANIQFEKGFYKNTGIDFQVFKVGTFKSAVEPYILDKMSEPNRQQYTDLLNDIWKTILGEIAESRSVSTEILNGYVDEGVVFANQATLVKKKLVDELKYSNEAELYVKEQIGIDKDDKLRTATVYDVKATDKTKKKNKDKIAVLYAEGVITDIPALSFLSGESSIMAKEYVKEIEKLRKDKDVKAVVLRVNSPGGSAFASEQIHHAIKTLKAEKPVVVSMGTVAASGGYYISAGASKIIAEPATITGSIGIFGLIPNAEQLSKKLGLTYDNVKTNKFADFGGQTLSIPMLGIGLFPSRPFNESESRIVQTYIERGYDTFLSRCAEGRGKTKEEIDAIGQGRVWTGNQALANGLVDSLGGIEDAIETAAKLAEISDYSLDEYPAQKTVFEQILSSSLEETRSSLTGFIMGKENYHKKLLLESWTHYDFRQAILPLEFK